MDELKKQWQNEILKRLKFVKILVVLAIVGIFCRLIYIQFFDENIGKVSHQVHKRPFFKVRHFKESAKWMLSALISSPRL